MQDVGDVDMPGPAQNDIATAPDTVIARESPMEIDAIAESEVSTPFVAKARFAWEWSPESEVFAASVASALPIVRVWVGSPSQAALVLSGAFRFLEFPSVVAALSRSPSDVPVKTAVLLGLAAKASLRDSAKPSIKLLWGAVAGSESESQVRNLEPRVLTAYYTKV